MSSNDATADELWRSEDAALHSTMTNAFVVFISSTFIFRYDVRATLESAPVEPHDNYINRLDYLPPAEQQAEMMAEKERYYSLYINEVEEELYKGMDGNTVIGNRVIASMHFILEEQMKREKTDYNQIAFNYDEIGPKEPSATVSQEPDENDTTPFTPSVKLDLPVDMGIPSTLKLNQIIEKTAKFISSQGPQMEILLKTKQSANPQFNFLNHDGQYNSYYKHILGMMKNGSYPWQDTIVKSEENSQDSEDLKSNGNSDPAASIPATIVIPKLVFKPSADCAYTQLISKITKAPIAELEKQAQQEIETHKNGATSSGTSEAAKKSTGLMGLVHYSSDSDSEDDENNVNSYTGSIPPSALRLVIDKTAIYVAKNGDDFEQTLRKKQDSRFQFLDQSNEFYKYYVSKVSESRGTTPQQQAAVVAKPKEEVNMPKAPPTPVCFSIKTKEEKSQLKPAILQASSDDEHKETTEVLPKVPTSPTITSVEEELELQVDAMNAEREEKLAKEKLSDKLLNAAREKLGMLPKEKMLQIERKKKAMMFINQIKGESEKPNPSANFFLTRPLYQKVPMATRRTAVARKMRLLTWRIMAKTQTIR